MATNLPSCCFIQFLEQLLKLLANFSLLKYVKPQRRYGFLITKEPSFGFQILDFNKRSFVSLLNNDQSLNYSKPQVSHKSGFYAFLSPPKTQHCLSFRGLRPTRALPWTHWGAYWGPPAKFSNDLWSLHVVSTAQLPQDWEFFLFSYWDWDFGLFQCWELGSEPPSPPPSGPSLMLLDNRPLKLLLCTTSF